MDPTTWFSSMEHFADILPTVYAVLGIVWVGALACWIAQKIRPMLKSPPGER